MNNKKITLEDKIIILEEKCASLDDGNYKKKQLRNKIDRLKNKIIFWDSSIKGTYNKKQEELKNKGMEYRLEQAHLKDLEEQGKTL